MTSAESEPAEEPSERRRPLVGVWAPISATVLWIALALRTPTNTFHFAPVVVAVAWPVLRRVDAGRMPTAEALLVSGAGVVLAIVVGAALSLTGNLEGPTLWGAGDSGVDDPLFEVVVFALGGGLAGVLIAADRGSSP